jgi:ubiquinone/menaquinone biosynthesis C-methylase UbiE
MDHQDHVRLLRGGVPATGGVWADFGAGQGAFTLALAELLGPTGTIYLVDKDARALRRAERRLADRFPELMTHRQTADIRARLDLPPLDGIIMANALHFFRHKGRPLEAVRHHLKPGGRFLLVEYNTDRGNPWVPHPLSYDTWVTLARRAGFGHTELLATAPSRFLGEFFAAASW